MGLSKYPYHKYSHKSTTDNIHHNHNCSNNNCSNDVHTYFNKETGISNIHGIKYIFSGNVPVDTSHAVLKNLYDLGYRRVSFVLSENHPKRDICDSVYSRYGFGTGRFMQLSTLINKAPVFNGHPPASLYGLTHPGCRCHFLVYPPQNLKDLTIPGKRLTVEQKEVLLSLMYPQSVNALSRTPEVKDINFDQYIEVKQQRPVEDNNLKNQPWYTTVWDFVKKNIFRKSKFNSDLVDRLYRYSDSVYQYGDIVRLMDEFVDLDFVVENHTPAGSIGFILSEDPMNSENYLVFLIQYSLIKIIPGNMLSYVDEQEQDRYKGVYYDKQLNEYIEVPLLRNLDGYIRIFNPFSNVFMEVPEDEIKK